MFLNSRDNTYCAGSGPVDASNVHISDSQQSEVGIQPTKWKVGIGLINFDRYTDGGLSWRTGEGVGDQIFLLSIRSYAFETFHPKQSTNPCKIAYSYVGCEINVMEIS